MGIDQYIRNCAQPCQAMGTCQFTQSMHILELANNALAEARSNTVSDAIWCDEGNHAFSSRDKGRKEIVLKGFEEETGYPEEDTRLACSEHLPKMRGNASKELT